MVWLALILPNGLWQIDHFNQMITLSMITLSMITLTMITLSGFRWALKAALQKRFTGKEVRRFRLNKFIDPKMRL